MFVIKKNLSLNFFCCFLNVCIFDISAHQATNCGFCMNCKSKSIFASRSDFFFEKDHFMYNVKSIFFMNVFLYD